MRSKHIVTALLVWLILCASVAAQTVARPAQLPANVLNEKLDSRLMDRQMPYRVVLPVKYGDKTKGDQRYPVVYLLHGLTGHFNNWTENSDLVKFASIYDLVIVTPEGDNGWYTDNQSKATDAYESYVVKELIPEIDKRFRTLSRREGRVIAGLSMGGYGALKFGLKYPDMFVLAGSFSGALGVASISERTLPGAVGRSVDQIFGPLDNPIRKSNDLFGIIRQASAESIKNFPFIYVDCGTEDFLFTNNRDFADLLYEKKVPHEFRQRPGGHTWRYWDRQVEDFLRLADRSVSKN